MIKVGDKVALFENMSKKGVVVHMYPQKSRQGMVGGTMAPIFIIRIKLDQDGTVEDHRADHVMRID
tara:strand:+ start:392 stop:589 length:198 start_codon:yes stop_codon:yes gene_type:complete